MDIGLAHEIEAAERQYLCARVENLLRIEGNPYGARVFSNGNAPCFYVEATPSPMFNRIYGDSPGGRICNWPAPSITGSLTVTHLTSQR